MNKRVTPQQLDMVQELSPEEALPLATDTRLSVASADHVDAMYREQNAFLAQAKISDSDAFDWLNDDSIVLREQPSTAIYTNKHGVIVIRQKADWDAEHDTFAFVTPENFVMFSEALAKVARE